MIRINIAPVTVPTPVNLKPGYQSYKMFMIDIPGRNLRETKLYPSKQIILSFDQLIQVISTLRSGMLCKTTSGKPAVIAA